MSKLMDEAIELLRNVPADLQDDLARMVMGLTGREQEVYRLSVEEAADIAASQAEAARGEFATDEELRAIWAKHGL